MKSRNRLGITWLVADATPRRQAEALHEHRKMVSRAGVLRIGGLLLQTKWRHHRAGRSCLHVVWSDLRTGFNFFAEAFMYYSRVVYHQRTLHHPPMPARKYGPATDRPVHVPTRLPRVVLAYLHVIVRLKRPHFSFNSLAQLHEEIVRCFLALAPYSPDFPWKTPRAASADDDDVAFRQCNFQLAPVLADALKEASNQAGVTRATFLYTATYHYIQQVATPKALQLL